MHAATADAAANGTVAPIDNRNTTLPGSVIPSVGGSSNGGGISGGEHHVAAFCGKRQGGGAANSLGAAGDERAFAAEVQIHALRLEPDPAFCQNRPWPTNLVPPPVP